MAYTPASSNTVAAPTNAAYLSTYSAMLEPMVIRQLFKKYGKQFGVLDLLRLNGSEINLSRDSITSFAEGATERPIKVKTAVTALTSNGGNYEFQFYIDPDSYDTNDKTFLRIGDVLHVPGYYFGQTHDVTFRVYEVGATDAALTKASAFNSTIAASDTLTQDFPADGYLQIGATAYGRGMGQPAARQFGFYSSTFYTAISKETIEMHGGVQAQELYFPVEGIGGKPGLWGYHHAKADFLLDSQISTNLWQGELNSNTNLVGTDVNSANSTIKGTKGLWLHAEDSGADHEYIDAFTVKDLDAIDDLFKAVGVMCQSAVMAVGHKLYKQIQDAAHDYISQYSGGSDLLEGMSKIGFTMKEWERSGITFKLVNLAQLSNNQTFGANQKNFWNYAGLVMPDEEVSIEDRMGGIYNSEGRLGGKITLPNVSVGYLNNNAEDRKRIVDDVAGVNGMGFKATEQYDRAQLFMLSEYAAVCPVPDKLIRLFKDGTN